MATTGKTPPGSGRRSSTKAKQAKKAKKSAQSGAAANPTRSVGADAAAAQAASATGADVAASNRFVRDLQVRGEALKPESDGKLALNATHAITEEKDGIVQKVKRARFKAF